VLGHPPASEPGSTQPTPLIERRGNDGLSNGVVRDPSPFGIEGGEARGEIA
jgi:hypothetical protein